MVGSVEPKESWAALLADPQARLVDVRTPAEWQHVGVAELGQAGKAAVLVSWQFADGSVNREFLEELGAAGISPAHTLYFLCRSGVRSLAAAHAASAAGFGACFNVAEGFEGRAGWKAEGLPWRR